MPNLASLHTYKGSPIEIEPQSLALASSTSLSLAERQEEVKKIIFKIYEVAAKHVVTSSIEPTKYKRCYYFSHTIGAQKVEGVFYIKATHETARLKWNEQILTLKGKGARLIEKILLSGMDNTCSLPRLSDGNRFEVVDFTEEGEGSRSDGVCPKLVKYYGETIHPFCLAYLDHLVPKKKGCRIVAVGSKEGGLADEISVTYQKYLKSCIPIVEKSESYGKDNGDIVLGVGIEEVTRSRQAALRVLEKLTESLREGGYLILTGHKPFLVRADDFRRLGLIVKNMQIPENQHAFYVAQKI